MKTASPSDEPAAADERPLWPLVAGAPLPRIHVISDVHLEFGPYELPPDLAFDILVASGDIGPVEDAVRWLATCGKPVVYVLGNHEFYDREFDEVLRAARRTARGTQVRVLERRAATIGGIRFLGTTLWTSFGDWHPGLVQQAYHQMNDYELIHATRWFASARNLGWMTRQCRAARLPVPAGDTSPGAARRFHPAIAYQEHLRSVAWLRRELDKPFAGPTVVVTHHSPSFDSLAAFGISPALLRPSAWNVETVSEDLRRVAAYASPLEALLAEHRDTIALWTHGHLHAGLDVVAQGVRLLDNPRGYKVRPDVEPRVANAVATTARADDNPHPGRSPDYDWRLVVDLADGLARPLRRALVGPVARMRRQTREAEALLPFLLDDDSVPIRSVHEAFARRVTVFREHLDAILRNVADALDAGSEAPPLAALSPPAARPVTRDREPSEDPPQRHAEQQVALMHAWIAWTDTVPDATANALREWAAATQAMLLEAQAMGIEVHCVRLPMAALRTLLYSRTHVLRAAAEPDAVATYGRRLGALFGKTQPRRSIRVKRVAPGTPRTPDLLSLEDLA